jgi:hypothetical protein
VGQHRRARCGGEAGSSRGGGGVDGRGGQRGRVASGIFLPPSRLIYLSVRPTWSAFFAFGSLHDSCIAKPTTPRFLATLASRPHARVQRAPEY